MSNPPYGGVEPPFLKGDLEGFLYEVMRDTIVEEQRDLFLEKWDEYFKS